MSIFKNKKIWTKIIYVLLLIMVFQFVAPEPVEANEGWGILLNPIVSLVLAIGDGVNGILHSYIAGNNQILVEANLDTDGWEEFGAIFAAVAVGIVAVAVVVFTAGVALYAAAAIFTITITAGTLLTVAAVAVTSGVVVGFIAMSNWYPEKLMLPMFNYTVEEIFKNEIPLFDINFFDPMDQYVRYGGDENISVEIVLYKRIHEKSESENNSIIDPRDYIGEYTPGLITPQDGDSIAEGIIESFFEKPDIESLKRAFNGYMDVLDLSTNEGLNERKKYLDEYEKALENNADLQNIELPVLEEVTQIEKINLRDIDGNLTEYINEKNLNLFNQVSPKIDENNNYYLEWEPYKYYQIKAEDGTENKEITESEFNSIANTSVAGELSNVVSEWFVSIRNIAIVLMLSILLYIGIRILLSSVSTDKAKYKQMLLDWFVGMCLLFMINIIMVLAVNLVELLTDALKTVEPDNTYIGYLEDDDNEKLSKFVNDLKEKGELDSSFEYTIEMDGKTYINWPMLNDMSVIRLQAQMQTDTALYAGYTIVYLILIMFTVFFTFTYLKRVVYLAFLTIIAPMVAMTYPIDKSIDGSAQGFNRWLKEYIFNLLIQPLHLLIYTLLISSVFEFSSTNVIYMLVAIGFMIPAENLLRSLFGFSKSETAGSLAGAVAGGAMVSNMMQRLNRTGGGSGSPGYSNNEKQEALDDKPYRKHNSIDTDKEMRDLLGLGSNGNTSGNTNNNKQAKKGFLSNPIKSNALKKMKKRAKTTKPKKFKLSKNSSVNPKKKGFLSNPIKSNALKKMKKGAEKNNDSSKEMSKFARAKRVAGRRMKSGAKDLGKRGVKFTGKVAKKSLGLIPGAALGMIGVAAGIATGDPSNILQYGAVGGAAGYAAGNRAVNAITPNKEKSEANLNAIRRAWHGEEKYAEIQKQKEYNEFVNNEQNMEQLERRVGYERAKEMQDSGLLKEYINNNVKDYDQIAALDNMISDKKNDVENVNQAIALRKSAERTGDTTKMGSDQRKAWKERFAEEYKEKYAGTDSEMENMSNKTMRLIDTYWKKKE